MALRTLGTVGWDELLYTSQLRTLLLPFLVQPISDLTEIVIMIRSRADPIVHFTLITLFVSDRGGAHYTELSLAEPFLTEVWLAVKNHMWPYHGVLPWRNQTRPLALAVSPISLKEALNSRTTGGWQPFWQDAEHSFDDAMRRYTVLSQT